MIRGGTVTPDLARPAPTVGRFRWRFRTPVTPAAGRFRWSVGGGYGPRDAFVGRHADAGRGSHELARVTESKEGVDECSEEHADGHQRKRPAVPRDQRKRPAEAHGANVSVPRAGRAPCDQRKRPAVPPESPRVQFVLLSLGTNSTNRTFDDSDAARGWRSAQLARVRDKRPAAPQAVR